MISERIQKLKVSPLKRLFELAKELKNPCNLSYGQPHFDVPEPIRAAAIKAIQEEKNGYTQAQGIDLLREKALAHFAKRGAPQEDVIVTPALSNAFLLAMMTLTDPGDEILIPDPAFLFWKDLPPTLGVKPVFVDTYPDFRWRRERLEAKITPKTRAIVFSCPANPTGVVATDKELKMLAHFAEEHNLWVIYDEIYSLFNYEGITPSFSPLLPHRTVTMSGFSKNYGMTGWRLGLVSGPKEALGPMTQFQQTTSICPCTPLQYGALAALDYDMTPYVDEYRKKRDFLYEALAPHYNVIKPAGSIFFFVEVPEGMTGTEFAEAALEEELILMPGAGCSARDTHVRVSFGATDEQLERGADILVRMAKKYGNVTV
ncbi:MAG: pyridoxal phosphate-dependent aminotransferase [Verrucomicrobia bacterium]|nr:pyridoxal phosphate-dependent aminotransferase [Verrucomicrobiota bacterium]